MTQIQATSGATVDYVDFDFQGPWSDYGNPILLIHGFGCTWRIWSRQIPWLAQHRLVVAPNMRGSGGSTPPNNKKEWTFADMAADIHDLVVHLGIKNSAVVGLSMGGALALQYAVDYPSDLSQLVIVNAFVPGIPMSFMSDEQIENMKIVFEKPVREVAAQRMKSAFKDLSLRSWCIEMISNMNVDNYRAQAAASLTADVIPRLKSLTIPTTVIQCSEDKIITIEMAEYVSQQIPNSKLIILDGALHFGNLEMPVKFNQILNEVLKIS